MEDEVYIFEMTCHIPGKEPKTVLFKSTDFQHFLRTIKGVENALLQEDSEGLRESNILPSRKAHIYKLARKLAVQMLKEGGYQSSLFDEGV